MSNPSYRSRYMYGLGFGGAQHPVDIERVSTARHLKALAHDDLERLSGRDRLLGALDRREKVGTIGA